MHENLAARKYVRLQYTYKSLQQQQKGYIFFDTFINFHYLSFDVNPKIDIKHIRAFGFKFHLPMQQFPPRIYRPYLQFYLFWATVQCLLLSPD